MGSVSSLGPPRHNGSSTSTGSPPRVWTSAAARTVPALRFLTGVYSNFLAALMSVIVRSGDRLRLARTSVHLAVFWMSFGVGFILIVQLN